MTYIKRFCFCFYFLSVFVWDEMYSSKNVFRNKKNKNKNSSPISLMHQFHHLIKKKYLYNYVCINRLLVFNVFHG